MNIGWVRNILVPILAVIALFVVMQSQLIILQTQYLLNADSFSVDSNEDRVLEPDHVYVDKFGIEAPIIYVQEESEAAFQEALKYGVGHYPETALPGEPGNVYLFGHSSDLPWTEGDYKTVFALLTKIKQHDEIVVTDSEGAPYTYRVLESFIANPTDMSVLDQYNEEHYYLSLQTSYPLGTALKRLVVFAELLQDDESGTEQDDR